MKKICLLLLIIRLFTLEPLYSQQSFELTFGTEGKEARLYTFENNGNYLTLGVHSADSIIHGMYSKINIISQDGIIIKEGTIAKQDTSVGISMGFPKSNGNYFIAGSLSDTATPYDYNVSYLCEVNPELDIVWEKMYTIPLPLYSDHSIENFLITPDHSVIIEGRIDTSIGMYNDLLYLAKYDLEGNQLGFRTYTDWKDYSTGSELIFKPDSTGFYLIGDVPIDYVATDWIEFDLDLNLIDSGLIEDSIGYMNTPLTVRRLQNGNMIMANRSSELNGGPYDDLEMRIIDQNFNLIKDTILYCDESVYVPDHRGMGFIDENNIWVVGFEPSFLFLPGTTIFYFFLFDSNLHLKGMKQYGGDTRYWFIDLLPTSDGGCLVTGIVPEYEGSHNNDNSIIKVMPDDVLTHAEETLALNDRDVLVYPNPFGSELKMETMRNGLTFKLFDSMGRLVHSVNMNDLPRTIIKTEHLLPGFYSYQITDKNRTIQSGKLMKQ
jgi:hypothetical protein